MVRPPPVVYPLPLHDALPISERSAPKGFEILIGEVCVRSARSVCDQRGLCAIDGACARSTRSEEHTSELQSRGHLVCRLLLEKKKKQTDRHDQTNVTNDKSIE